VTYPDFPTHSHHAPRAHESATGPAESLTLKALVEPELLVLDDLFLAKRIPDAAAELLQTLVHHRYKQRRSILVTSNRVVQDWGRYLRDSTMASTILDRLLHRSKLLEFEGKSYRLREAATRLAVTEESDA
jgi:DNA replication protein DnaC